MNARRRSRPGWSPTGCNEYAAHRVPGHLDAVLQETSTMRQRPAWSSLERWLPVQGPTGSPSHPSRDWAGCS